VTLAALRLHVSRSVFALVNRYKPGGVSPPPWSTGVALRNLIVTPVTAGAFSRATAEQPSTAASGYVTPGAGEGREPLIVVARTLRLNSRPSRRVRQRPARPCGEPNMADQRCGPRSDRHIRE
jgi:hypothetical protein